jgi:hypothetical protein
MRYHASELDIGSMNAYATKGTSYSFGSVSDSPDVASTTRSFWDALEIMLGRELAMSTFQAVMTDLEVNM